MTSKKEISRKKNRANARIAYLVRHANLKYEDCAICGESPTVAHHENYDLWYSVIFLCEKHHRAIHKNDFINPIRLSRPTKKYTIERSDEDLAIIDKLRKHLQDNQSSSWKSYNTDSEIYRDLPGLYFDAVKRMQQLQLAIDELTAKLDVLEDLRSSICRIMEICKEEEGCTEK